MRIHISIPKTAATIFAACLVVGCSDSERPNHHPYPIVCSNSVWEVWQVNDSTLLCVPGLNADKNMKPQIIRTR